MNDGLDLPEVKIHPKQRTLICPHCGKEGRNFFLIGQWHDGAMLPGECKCGGLFIINVTSDPDAEAPLHTVASALLQISKSWDYRDLDLVDKARSQIKMIIEATPNIHKLDAEPVFEVKRKDAGIDIVPKNTQALRVMEILAELKTLADPATIEEPIDLEGI